MCWDSVALSGHVSQGDAPHSTEDYCHSHHDVSDDNLHESLVTRARSFSVGRSFSAGQREQKFTAVRCLCTVYMYTNITAPLNA